MLATHSLLLALESEIQRRHGGQLRRLRVSAREDGIDVEGEASSYYTKQLVIRDLLKLGWFPNTSIRITVRKSVHPCALDTGKQEEISYDPTQLCGPIQASRQSVGNRSPLAVTAKGIEEKEFAGILPERAGAALRDTTS